MWRGGKFANLGCFWSAEAAALCYARSPEGWAAAEAKRAEAPPALTAAAALKAAEAEGLVLPTSSSSGTRFLGVYRTCPRTRLPFHASLKRDGLEIILGRFATEEEAALCRARASSPRPPAPPPPTTSWPSLALPRADRRRLSPGRHRLPAHLLPQVHRRLGFKPRGNLPAVPRAARGGVGAAHGPVPLLAAADSSTAPQRGGAAGRPASGGRCSTSRPPSRPIFEGHESLRCCAAQKGRGAGARGPPRARFGDQTFRCSCFLCLSIMLHPS